MCIRDSIMPVVRAVTEADECRADFEALGYEYLGEFGIPGRRYLRKGGDERTHQMHIFAADDVHAIAPVSYTHLDVYKRQHTLIPSYKSVRYQSIL